MPSTINLLFLFMLALSVFCRDEIAAQSQFEWDEEALNTAKNINYLSSREIEMIVELNRVRTNPELYKNLVLDELKATIKDSSTLSKLISYSIKKRVTIINGIEIEEIDTIQNNFYQDRVTAIRDLLYDLDTINPLQVLKPHKNLYLAAMDHGNKQSNLGEVNHRGLDGSWPWERVKRFAPDIIESNENIAMGGCTPREIVMQLLIDSGVPGYGHRYNILNPKWDFVGCREVMEISIPCGYWIQEFGQQGEDMADLINSQ